MDWFKSWETFTNPKVEPGLCQFNCGRIRNADLFDRDILKNGVEFVSLKEGLKIGVDYINIPYSLWL
jgi:hypothetical protein